MLKAGREHKIAVLVDGKYFDVATNEIIKTVTEDVLGQKYSVISKLNKNFTFIVK